ncbi:hypothetical protein [Flagellimonas algicola]|uniref:Outer membrane lipoprotein-sorting protein n=1 Tax=Flagellimonas algicola TaxID=2583815 RepID=A0ABY2WGW4_9FLAO|nr:hypothetical protein [Allomuricauda algicola]TMU50823.1 hypothetical protein FGG15_16475 [Allomuricauda algicola]
MKYYFFLALISFTLISACKNEPKAEPTSEKELSIPEKIAQAHGYDAWKSVKKITFTFKVGRDSTNLGRTWIWEPKTNKITSITQNDTLVYNRNSMDSLALKRNGGFINDRFWILAPFNLIWDANNYTSEHQEGQKAPISGESMQKLTIVYGNEGGYTPGDAYDFYFKDDFILREWVFRKANQAEPSMTTTWEDYMTLEGLKLAQDHRKAEGDFSLNFTNLSVKKE